MATKGRKITLLLTLIVMAVLAVTAWRAWPTLRFWWRFEALGLNAQGFPEFRHRQTGIVFVRLPGGTFWMGAQKENPDGQNYDFFAKDSEGPVHEVILNPFLIGKYEVTQVQWKKVMGTNPSKFTGDAGRPVEMVSWDDIQEFEAKTGLALPTEAQWEYACRAGTPPLTAETGDLRDIGWCSQNSENTTHRVGQKTSNSFGLFDMHGNVWERCEDIFDPNFHVKSESRGPDPVATSGSSNWRVIKGGSWCQGGGLFRPSLRYKWEPRRSNFIGFRTAHPWPF